MSARTLRVALALGLLACGKSESKREHASAASRGTQERAPADESEEAPRSLEDELHHVESDETYEPTPLDLPLTADFAKAAAKRVTAENYRKELARIERELAYESKQSAPR